MNAPKTKPIDFLKKSPFHLDTMISVGYRDNSA
jgi:hypothetical protein